MCQRDESLCINYGTRSRVLAEEMRLFTARAHRPRIDCTRELRSGCVRVLMAVRACVQENWQTFVADQVQDMTAHLMPYPMTVTSAGKIVNREGHEFIPDSQSALVFGDADTALPDMLLT